MALTASISIIVPVLPDNDVWWENSQAWSNYWRNIGAEATFDPAVTTTYVPVNYDDTLIPVVQTIAGIDYVLVTQAMFTSLLNKVQALDAAFQNMRDQMKDAGFITQSQ